MKFALRRTSWFFFALLSFLIFGGALCQQQPKLPAPIELNFWRVWDEDEDFTEIIEAFEGRYPYITINYRRLTFEEYENALKEGWALGRGPDIFSVHNTWVTKYQPFIAPIPEKTTMMTQTVKKSLAGAKTDITINQEEHIMPTLRDLDNLFVHVVTEDAVLQDQIYGLPLSVDSLALYYNKTLLDRAHIPEAPKTWDAFTQTVPSLTIVDEENKVLQAGAALGTSNNIRRSFDLLSLLMMQNHTPMAEDNDINLTFKTETAQLPGLQALEFYTAFASPQKEVYSWNEEMGDSLEAFNQGTLAFYFGYSYDLPTIRSRGKNIRFDLAPMLQVDEEVNYANYWLETVAQASTHQNEAWDFVNFMTQDPTVRTYLVSTKRPTALKALINEQSADPDLGTFVVQNLTAKSWYHGRKPNDAENIMNELITEALKNPDTAFEALQNAQQRLQVDY